MIHYRVIHRSCLLGPVTRLPGKVLVVGGAYRGGFREKLQKAFPVSDKASASQLQHGLAAGQGQANQ